MLDLDGIERMLKLRENPGSTHYEDCYLNHPICAGWAMLEELRKLSAVTTSDTDG